MRRKIRRDARVAEGAPLLREYRVKSLIEGSNPSLSARYAKRPQVGRFAYLAERRWWTNPLVRQIRPERIWTAVGWPWSAQRGRVWPKDGPNNPSRRTDARTIIEARPRMGRFADLAKRRWTPCTRWSLQLCEHPPKHARCNGWRPCVREWCPTSRMTGVR